MALLDQCDSQGNHPGRSRIGWEIRLSRRRGGGRSGRSRCLGRGQRTGACACTRRSQEWVRCGCGIRSKRSWWRKRIIALRRRQRCFVICRTWFRRPAFGSSRAAHVTLFLAGLLSYRKRRLKRRISKFCAQLINPFLCLVAFLRTWLLANHLVVVDNRGAIIFLLIVEFCDLV